VNVDEVLRADVGRVAFGGEGEVGQDNANEGDAGRLQRPQLAPQLLHANAKTKDERISLCCMVYGLWFMDYGLWIMVYGLWFMGFWFLVYGLRLCGIMVYGLWFMGFWFLVYGLRFCGIMVYGLWFMGF